MTTLMTLLFVRMLCEKQSIFSVALGSKGVVVSLTLNPDGNAVAQHALVSVKPIPKPEQAPTATVAVKPPVEPMVDQDQVRENLHDAIDKLNEQVERNGRGLNFAVDERLNRPVITVRNTSTGEVVRQIPNEVIIKVAHSIEDIKGLLLDQMM